METVWLLTGATLLLCLLGLSWFAGTDAPYVPTKTVRIKKALQAAGLKKGQVFWELGSGDGRVVMEAAKMGAEVYGIEQSWIRVLMSRWKAYQQKLPNSYFEHGNIFKMTFPKNADVIYIFLLPAGVEKLEPILKKNLKKGSRVITQTFHFKKWPPYKKILVTDKNIPNSNLGVDQLEGDFWIYRV